MTRRAWIGPLVVAAAAVGMAAFTWGRWPDPIVDFGKEVYIAWQLSLGKHLYTDVAYHLGPLSPYFNALAFKLFGPTLATIEWVNLFLIAIMIALIYRLVRRIAGDLAAAAAGVTFVCLFAFGHFTPIADYNFVCPYDHAHTHGLLLGLLGLTAADIYRRDGRLWALAAAGLAVGLAFLTRAELFVADFLAVIAVLAIKDRANVSKPIRRGLAAVICIFSAAFVIPILVTWIVLGTRAVLGSWPIVFDTSVASNPFYRDSMGTLHIGDSVLRLVRWSICWSLIFFPPLAVAKFKSQKKFLIIAAAVFGGAVAYLAGHFQDPAEAFAPLPIALLVILWLGRHKGPLAIGMIVWAIVLLGKIWLNARIAHYGFALAMPATLVVVAATLGWMPVPVRAAAFGALVVTIFAHLGLIDQLQRQQTLIVGSGSDSFCADERGDMLYGCLIALRHQASPGQTLAVMPEGAMLNFLAKMPNPTPYWSFNPPYSFFAPGAGEAAGEDKMLNAFKSHPPDWVVFVAEDLSDFGTPFFGRDYGVQLYGFVQQNYSPVAQWGARPFSSDEFGIMLLRRRVYNAAAP